MFRFDKSEDKRDSAKAAQLISFNHMNGESAASSQQHLQNQALQNKIRPNYGSPQTEIVGPTGTVRGFKNIIRQRKEFLRMSFVGETLQENEEGKIVVYTTSMGGIRSTVEECAYIRKLFDNLGLKVDERDIFMHKDYQCQLDKRLGIQNASVPHVLINGISLGHRGTKPLRWLQLYNMMFLTRHYCFLPVFSESDLKCVSKLRRTFRAREGVKELEHLNETGELKSLLENFERRNSAVCQSCGGFRYINCAQCHGSKRSRKTRISRHISVLRCTSCNENGLQRCPECTE